MLHVLFLIAFLVSSSTASFGIDEVTVEHLKEHFGNKIEIEKHTSENDRKFYYFQVGDTNNDHFLDGIELYKLITEHAHDEKDVKGHQGGEFVESHVDQVIKDMDTNGDGLISFSEYSKSFH